jgi:hypothetical protein
MGLILNLLTNLFTESLLFSVCIEQVVLLMLEVPKVGVLIKGPCLHQSILDA